MLATSLASSIYQTGTGLSCAQNTPLLQTVAIATPQAIEIIQEYNLSRTTTISELSEAQSELSVLSALLPTTSRVSSPRSCMFVSQIYVCSCACCSSPSACTKVLWVLTVRKRSLISLLPVQASLPENYHNPAVCVCACVCCCCCCCCNDGYHQTPQGKFQTRIAKFSTTKQIPARDCKIQSRIAKFNATKQISARDCKTKSRIAKFSATKQIPARDCKIQSRIAKFSTTKQIPARDCKIQSRRAKFSTTTKVPARDCKTTKSNRE